MSFVSVTRLRLRSWWFLPPFAWSVLRIERQVRRAAGFRTGGFGYDSDSGFWTFTVWDDEGAMRAFRAEPPHATVMPKLAGWCSEASFAHWERRAAGLPDPSEALERLRSDGRLSRVGRPSPAHTAGRSAPTSDPPRVARTFAPE